MGLTSTFWDGNGKNKQIKLCSRYVGKDQELPAIWDGNGNYQKAFLLFGTETGNPKIFLLFGNRYLRRSRWEIYGNGNSRSCLGRLHICVIVFQLQPIADTNVTLGRIQMIQSIHMINMVQIIQSIQIKMIQMIQMILFRFFLLVNHYFLATFPLHFLYFSATILLLFHYFSAFFPPLFCYFSSTFQVAFHYFSANFSLIFR